MCGVKVGKGQKRPPTRPGSSRTPSSNGHLPEKGVESVKQGPGFGGRLLRCFDQRFSNLFGRIRSARSGPWARTPAMRPPSCLTFSLFSLPMKTVRAMGLATKLETLPVLNLAYHRLTSWNREGLRYPMNLPGL